MSKKLAEWKPFYTKQSVSACGGMLTKPVAIEVLSIDTPAGLRQFVKLEKQSKLAIEAVAGAQAQKGCLKRTKLVEYLKRHLNEIYQESEASAVAGAAPETSAVADDPMNGLDFDDVDAAPVRKSKAKTGGLHRIRKAKKRARDSIVVLDVPARSVERHPDCTERRNVSVYRHNSARDIWLDIRDLPWAFEHMRDQYILGGVPRLSPPADAAVAADAAPWKLAWDFHGDQWVITHVRGPAVGHRERMKVQDMSQEQLNEVAHENGLPEPRAYEQKKEATRRWLIRTVERRVVPPAVAGDAPAVAGAVP